MKGVDNESRRTTRPCRSAARRRRGGCMHHPVLKVMLFGVDDLIETDADGADDKIVVVVMVLISCQVDVDVGRS